MNEHETRKEEPLSSNLAPKNEAWHVLYVMTMCRIQDQLFRLTQHEDFKYAEDLGDFVDGISTLMSFRPQTRDDLELLGRGEYEEDLVKERG